VDYARRKGVELAEAERWLGPYLSYEPAVSAAWSRGVRRIEPRERGVVRSARRARASSNPALLHAGW